MLLTPLPTSGAPLHPTFTHPSPAFANMCVDADQSRLLISNGSAGAEAPCVSPQTQRAASFIRCTPPPLPSFLYSRLCTSSRSPAAASAAGLPHIESFLCRIHVGIVSAAAGQTVRSCCHWWDFKGTGNCGRRRGSISIVSSCGFHTPITPLPARVPVPPWCSCCIEQGRRLLCSTLAVVARLCTSLARPARCSSRCATRVSCHSSRLLMVHLRRRDRISGARECIAAAATKRRK